MRKSSTCLAVVHLRVLEDSAKAQREWQQKEKTHLRKDPVELVWIRAAL
jgi:hypothetical protein